MPNQTDLLNFALGKCGVARINAIDDGSTNANHCLTIYPGILDSALRNHHWNFATGRATLALLTDAPLFEYAYAYALPSDFIKLQRYYDAVNDLNSLIWDFNNWPLAWQNVFRIETYVPIGAPPGAPPVKILVSNGTNAQIVYTRRIENPDLWDGEFYQYIACWLASDLALAISKDAQKSDILLKQSVFHLGQAVALDGQEQSIEPFESNSLLWGR